MSHKNFDQLDKVGLIIDMDGFKFSKKPFQCKELAFCYTYKQLIMKWHFKLDEEFQHLPPNERITASYLCHYVHGMRYQNYTGDWAKSSLTTIIRVIYNNMLEETRSEKPLIAYKGGHIEKDVLDSLKIPSINLEVFGCPKADILFEKYCPLTKQCGMHLRLYNKKIAHCPCQETSIFKAWMLNNLKPHCNEECCWLLLRKRKTIKRYFN